MKASLIISIYKNISDLKVVLDALEYQTERDFEIIISEDGNDKEVAKFVQEYQSSFPVIHLSQPDEGWRKNQALNRAILASNSEYLIFIDGDCVLHHRFVQQHLRLAQARGIVAGKRIKLGLKFSEKLRHTPLPEFEKSLLFKLPALIQDRAKFVEEGFFINPDGPFNFIAAKRKMRWLKGCNFSCYKLAMIEINGFDEDYQKPAIGEDIDLTWRFNGLGYRLISARNYAVQYHLYHKENWTSQVENEAIMANKQAQNKYVCSNGLRKLSLPASGNS
jgi:GT2 family glycosyltransferase